MSSPMYYRSISVRGSIPARMLIVAALLFGLLHSASADDNCLDDWILDTVTGSCTHNLCGAVMCNHGHCEMQSRKAVCVCDFNWRNDPNDNTGITGKCTVCKAGYATPAGLPNFCIDVNECASPTTACGAGVNQCTNTLGSFTCTCKPGWKLIVIKNPDGRLVDHCTNINECAVLYGVCRNNTMTPTCTDTEGSYSCNCKAGFVEKSNLLGVKNCHDMDECALTPFACSGGTCRNTFGSYACDCNSGYELKYTLAGMPYCREINECYRYGNNAGFCQNAYNCSNTAGSYTCNCKPGYTQLTDRTSGYKTCVDINECGGLWGLGTCGLNANSCINTIGSYYCNCKPGFMPVNKQCVDINECSFNGGLGSCGAGAASCSNTPGNYTCNCKSGYRQEGSYPNYRCVDINECAETALRCGYVADTVCTNTPGSWTCACPTAPVKYIPYKAPTAAGPVCLIDKCAPIGGTNPCIWGTCYPTTLNSWRYDCNCVTQYTAATSTAGPTCSKPPS